LASLGFCLFLGLKEKLQVIFLTETAAIAIFWVVCRHFGQLAKMTAF